MLNADFFNFFYLLLNKKGKCGKNRSKLLNKQKSSYSDATWQKTLLKVN